MGQRSIENGGTSVVLVLVTGGTGFVGSHSVKALLEAGHSVRMFVRNSDRIAPALEPLGVETPEYVVGDVTDPDAVRPALDGCGGVLHGASVYTQDPRRASEIRETNLAGARNVLGTAVELGLDPVVHVSSVVALMPAKPNVISEETPVGTSGPAYPASKAVQEAYARELQEAGAPVVTTYPGSVWGPHDPHDGESVLLARRMVRGLMPFVPTGGFPLVDVRDVATAHAGIFDVGRGPRRYMLGGNFVQLRKVVKDVCAEASVRRPRIPIPNFAGYYSGVAAGVIQRVLPFRLPIEAGSTWVVRCNVRADNSLAESDLGITFRPAEDAVRDQVVWQKAAGRL
jgi:nucleoside-diphosphate-sugar epimerase